MCFSTKVYRDFDTIPEAVIAKWQGQNGLTFDQTFEWYRLLFEHVMRDSRDLRLVVVCLPEKDTPVALLPLSLTKEQVLPLGIRGLQSLTNYYSSVFNLIPLSSEVSAGVVDDVCDAIGSLQNEARFIELEPMPRSEQTYTDISGALALRGYILSPYRRFSNWYHLSNGQSFAEYFSERESRIQNTFKRKEKKLSKIGYDIEIVKDIAAVDLAMEDYFSVYEKSWKGTESHPAFITALCHMFAAKGWLRLGILKISGRPIAAQIWFVHQGVASIFKLSYDEDHKSLSAGSVLTMALMRHVLDVDRVDKVDYLTGDDAYKRKYMNSSREMWSIRAYSKTSFAGVFGVLEAVKDSIRKSSDQPPVAAPERGV